MSGEVNKGQIYESATHNCKQLVTQCLKGHQQFRRHKNISTDGNKGVITPYNFDKHIIYSHLVQPALSFHFSYICRPLQCRKKLQKEAQAADSSTATNFTILFL